MKNYFTEEKTKQVIETWSNTSLLEGLNDIDKERVAISYEIVSTMITNDISPRFSDACVKLIFPIIRRIISKQENLDDINVDILTKQTIDIIETLNKSINNLNQPWDIKRLKNILDKNVDIEAEFVAEFCKNYKYTKGKYTYR